MVDGTAGGGVYGTSTWSGTSSYRGSGGGATDISTVYSAVSYSNYRSTRTDESLKGRLIVSGGGGGSGNILNGSSYSYGGGSEGGAYTASYAGKQSSAGTNGAFGYGANQITTNYKYVSPGGGGGWYGGGASGYSDTDTNYCYYSGGGSGFVWTSSTAGNVPSGYSVPTSYYLKNAQTISGNVSMPTQDGTTTMTGNSGNGYAKITLLSL